MPRIMIVVGEASGDLHGANLITELKKIYPNIFCYGLGGKYMRKAGAEILTDASELSVVGLVEIIRHYPRLHSILKRMINELKLNPPDLLVLIDSPDFNLRLAKAAKKYDIKVLYYISPQVWAWRESRIKLIKKCVDMIAVVFQFEVKFYKDAKIPVKYVGHPLTKDAVATASRDNVFQNEKLDASKKLIGIFPGSRKSEIERILPILIDAAENLALQRDDVQFIIPIASTLHENFIKQYSYSPLLNIKTTKENIYNVINACDVIAAASGTVTLQITLMQTPYLIVYKVSSLTYYLLKRIVNFKFAGIANIIANKEICREFLQNDARPKQIALELEKLLSDKRYADNMKKEMKVIKEQLGNK
ncbi:MAG: lipid-A-disaccharide synthase, partial [Gammaproteobacteria bacterium]